MAEISIGELLDKITILKIKKIKIKDKDKIKLIDKELKSLNETLKLNVSLDEKVLTLMLRLENVNKKLWDIENQKREIRCLAGMKCSIGGCDENFIVTEVEEVSNE